MLDTLFQTDGTIKILAALNSLSQIFITGPELFYVWLKAVAMESFLNIGIAIRRQIISEDCQRMV